MTTQELKQYIDKVLGNSIRCLLPSYWWKRLFNQVADRIDEVEQTTSKLIDSKVEEVKMPIVESESELYELKIEEGSLAAVVGGGPRKFSECFQANYDELVFPLSDNRLARIQGIGVNYVNNVTDDFIVSILNKTNTKKIWLSVSKDLVGAADISTGQEFIFYRSSDSAVIQKALDVFNAYLKEDEFYYIETSFSSNMGNTSLEIVDNYFSIQATSDLYIKGDSWKKLSKEYVVSSEEELNALSVENGTIAKVAKWQYGEVDPYQCYSITNESSHDDDTIKRIWDKLTRISHIDITYPETPPTVMPAWPTILLHGYASTSDDVIQITYYQESYKIEVSNSDSTNIVSIDKMNTILQEKDYRLIILTNDKYARPFIEEHITFYSPNANITADAYIKGETWTRLLKEGDVTGGVSQEDFDTLYNGVVEAEEVTAAALINLNERLNTLSENVAGETVTKTEFETAISGLSNTVLENEEITATALTDLNSQIKEIITRLNNAGL
jgi:hypothetical protein